MGQSRHQFIYGFKGQERADFLKATALSYPVDLDKSNPVGIYIDNIGLPEIKDITVELDDITLSALSREYCYFSIASKIMDTIMEQVDNKDLFSRESKFLDNINRLFINKFHKPIEDLKVLRTILVEAKQAYYFEYEKFVACGELKDFTINLPISFMMLEWFIEYSKKMLNTSSYFGIIIDYQSPISIKSQQAINSLIGSRINSDLSIKVACEPLEWKSHYDFNGNPIQSVHDYGTVEIDDCYKEHMKKLKK